VPSLKIGTVNHFYPKIGVAVLDLVADLATGDQIMFKTANSFSQTVTSMQIEHETVIKAKKGQKIGLKVDQPVKPGDEVLREY
jgi:U32 family peptidase